MGAHYIIDLFKKAVIIPAIVPKIQSAIKDVKPTDGSPVTFKVEISGTAKRELTFQIENLDEILEILELNAPTDDGAE